MARELVPSSSEHRLTAAAFQQLAAVPLEAEWFTNLANPATRPACRPEDSPTFKVSY